MSGKTVVRKTYSKKVKAKSSAPASHKYVAMKRALPYVDIVIPPNNAAVTKVGVSNIALLDNVVTYKDETERGRHP